MAKGPVNNVAVGLKNKQRDVENSPTNCFEKRSKIWQSGNHSVMICDKSAVPIAVISATILIGARLHSHFICVSWAVFVEMADYGGLMSLRYV